MAEKRDYYEVLGIEKTATDGEIKRCYRKLAMKYHPDRNPGDRKAEDRFKEAAEAYEVLKDPRKRQIYDQFGHQGLEGNGFSGFSNAEDIFSSFGDIFGDLFSGFGFGGRRSGPRVSKGADLRYDLTLSFMEGVFGAETEIDVEKSESCAVCGGNRCEPGTQPEPCSHCNGTGQVTRSQGFFTVRTTCPYCRGQGKSIPSPCKKCRGRGQVMVSKRVPVKIPPGVDTGARLRLTGEGEASVNGGPSGDLYVFIHVKPHDFFKREDTDIICQIEISFIQAILGDEITVPTLEGEKNLKIPTGTQYGDRFRFKGEGIPSLRNKNHRGDQIIEAIIRTPTSINKKQENLLKEFARLEDNKLSNKLLNILKSGSRRRAS